MAKASIHFAVTPDVLAHLVAVYARGMVEGVDFMARSGSARSGMRQPAPRLSRSAIIRQAIKYGAESCAGAMRVTVPALPERTGTTDANRLIAARGTMTRQECARAAGLKDESSVRNVESRGMALAGKLRAWVESVEGVAK